MSGFVPAEAAVNPVATPIDAAFEEAAQDMTGSEVMSAPEAGDSAEVGSVDMDFGDELHLDEELEATLRALEAKSGPGAVEPSNGFEPGAAGIPDLEDAGASPMELFRRKGWLSVSDLVGTVWCEVQYDYRLRTLPYLPPSQRPDTIKTKTGEQIKVDKVKVEDKERILVRGQKIHKKLEREIFPEEIVIRTNTREDVWGLRFLTMFSGMEALLSLGKCREMPVVGFVHGVQIMGIIDELTLQPVAATSSGSRSTRSSKAAPLDPNQTKLSSFFASTSSKAPPMRRAKTHRLVISDSKTRASGHLPQEDDARAARLQVMCYKELLDGMLLSPFVASGDDPPDSPVALSDAASAPVNIGRPPEPLLPSRCGFSFEHLFSTLDISVTEPFSELFLQESKPIILGNGLKHGTTKAKTLSELIGVWGDYVRSLGLGDPPSATPAQRSSQRDEKAGTKGDTPASQVAEQDWGKTEDTLQLVYRRAGAVKRHRRKEGASKEEGVEGSERRRGHRGKRSGRQRTEQGGEPQDLAEAEGAEDLGRDGMGGVNGSEDIVMAEGSEDSDLQRAIRLSLELSNPKTGAPDPPSNETGSIKPETMPQTQSIASPHKEGVPKPLPDTINPFEQPSRALPHAFQSEEELDREEDELALAIELSLGTLNPIADRSDSTGEGEELIPLRLSQPKPSATSTASPATPRTETALGTGTGSGSIIGTSTFRHSPRLLAVHLEHVLRYWRGEREPVGVPLEHARRCGWCEFEEGCEWRRDKAREVWERRRQAVDDSGPSG